MFYALDASLSSAKDGTESEVLEAALTGCKIATDLGGPYHHHTQDDYYNESWVKEAFSAVSRLCLCSYQHKQMTVSAKRSGKERKIGCHLIAGRRDRVEAARRIANFVEASVRRIGKAAEAEYTKKNRARDPRPVGNDVKRKVGHRVVEAIKEARAAMLTDAATRSSFDVETGLTQRYIYEKEL